MRFVWAVAAFVLAAVMIATGIAQRTVFQGPKTATTAVSQPAAASYTLIDGAVLNRLPGSQTLRAAQSGTIFAAYARTSDMKSWLSDVAYTSVTLNEAGKVVDTVVPPTAAGPDGAADRDPAGSDLWLDQFQQDDILIQHLQLPDTMSVLVATDGTKPAPAAISVTWSLQTNTPWAGPLIAGGSILMAIGVFLYILGLRSLRRRRGPRRKALPPLPETEPIDISVAAADKGVISAGPASTRTPLTRRRTFAVVPVLAISALLMAGCSADAWPQLGASATPTPTRTVVDPSGVQQPAVTPSQADRILARISQTIASADEKQDAKLAATRLTGAALAERETNYTLRGKISGEAALPAIPATGVKVVLPQAYDGWPRTILLIAEQKADTAVTSTIMMMAQQDAWSQYKLSYTGQLEAAELPDVAPAYVGAAAVQPDSSFLVMPPEKIAAAYADIIDHGDASASAGAFDTHADLFLKGVMAKRKEQLAEFDKTAAKADKDAKSSKTGSLTFTALAGSAPPLALATLESGAIVAVNVNETETVKPTNADAVIKLTNNPRVQALTGVKESQTGFTTTYSDQLFFYVPGVGSGDASIRLLGYSSNILGAKVVSKK
ncbi:hypothetical protein GCM10022240_25560 [Microbacterium kribbense]|uniref:DUF8094 domain-containing protein n=1 Tax=Microbacterium kribbense TaxID=433645 RepID=A0ABP7GPB4_9MICO